MSRFTLDSPLHGGDYGWLASDRLGQCAYMITAGVGPVPAGLDEDEYQKITELGDELIRYPVISDFVVCTDPYSILDSFTELAQRGIFAYDWSDVHVTSQFKRNAFELIAEPSVALHVNVLQKRHLIVPLEIENFREHAWLSLEAA